MSIIKREIKEERISELYTISDKPFTPEITYRDGKFHQFTLHIETNFKTKYDFKLDAEDEEVFNALKNFFKSLSDDI